MRCWACAAVAALLAVVLNTNITHYNYYNDQQHKQQLQQSSQNAATPSTFKVTPLMAAAYTGNLKQLKVILHNDPQSIDAVSARGETALHYALRVGFLRLMLIPVQGRQESLFDRSELKSGPGQYEEVLVELLRAGANASAGMMCPLWYAVAFRNSVGVQLLLDNVHPDHRHYCLHQRTQVH